MKSLSGHDLARLLELRGWRLLRISGSHHIYGKHGSAVRLSVPIHGNRPLKIGLLRIWRSSPKSLTMSCIERAAPVRHSPMAINVAIVARRWAGIVIAMSDRASKDARLSTGFGDVTIQGQGQCPTIPGFVWLTLATTELSLTKRAI